MSWRRSQTVVLILAINFIGCSRKVDRAAVVGEFLANHSKGLDAVDLEQDGTYVYTCHLKDQKEWTHTDHWNFYYQEGHPRITFDNFIFCVPEYAKHPGYWDVEVERSATGKLELSLDPDLNYYFVKK